MNPTIKKQKNKTHTVARQATKTELIAKGQLHDLPFAKIPIENALEY